MYFTWAEIESCSSVGREVETEARPGPDTRDILVVCVLLSSCVEEMGS